MGPKEPSLVLPVWMMTQDSCARGEQLAWTVMQHIWQDEVEETPITQLTPPDEMLAFVERHPGLVQIAKAMPRSFLEHAPQLAIRGFGGRLEEAIEKSYEESVREQAVKRARNDPSGSGLTFDGFCPTCDDCFAIRHPEFGNYDAAHVACGYVQGNGAGLGPHTQAFDNLDYVVWLLSRKSEWLPYRHRAFLLQGMKEWAVWPWMRGGGETGYDGENSGELWRLLHETLESTKIREFKLTDQATNDLRNRIAYSRHLLSLPEPTVELVEAFLTNKILQGWFAGRSRTTRRRTSVSRTNERRRNTGS